MRDYEKLRENAWEAIYAAREARAQAKLPIMPFRRVFRSNKQALDWLLTREEKGLPPAPSAVLLDWIATIPARSIRARAKRGETRRQLAVAPACLERRHGSVLSRGGGSAKADG